MLFFVTGRGSKCENFPSDLDCPGNCPLPSIPIYLSPLTRPSPLSVLIDFAWRHFPGWGWAYCLLDSVSVGFQFIKLLPFFQEFAQCGVAKFIRKKFIRVSFYSDRKSRRHVWGGTSAMHTYKLSIQHLDLDCNCYLPLHVSQSPIFDVSLIYNLQKS